MKQGGLALTTLAISVSLPTILVYTPMTDSNTFEVIIIGGSYAGLSAAMALGRSLRRVLVIDSGLPCNRQTPHSHNFITQDGEKPGVIAQKAKAEVLKYSTVKFLSDVALSGKKTDNGFVITTKASDTVTGEKLIFATGIRDIMPEINGFSECWGTSIIHCPYCHGYEVKNEVTGILANGDAAMHTARLVSNLTKDLTVFTNGPSTFTSEQVEKLAKNDVKVVETAIDRFAHTNRQIERIIFTDGTSAPLKALYARVPFVQHSDIPQMLGCELTEHGYLKVNALQQTTVPGVLACGDNTTLMRSVATAVATGNFAGAVVNNELCEAYF